MLQVIKTLQQLLEAGSGTIISKDLEELDDASRGFLIDSSILEPTQPAKYAVCENCDEDHVEEISSISDNSGHVRFRIYCPSAGWVPVDEVQLKQYAINRKRLMARLADAVSPNESAREIVRGLVWQIGTIEIANEVFSIVFLINGRGIDTELFHNVGAAVPPMRTILIGTNKPECDMEFAAKVEFASVFRFNENSLVWQPERVRSMIATDALANANVFQSKREIWQLSFGGKTIYQKSSVGLQYLVHLLRNPSRSISAIELSAIRSGFDPVAMSGSKGEVLTAESRENYRVRLNEINEELRIAERDNDTGSIEGIQTERDQLIREITSATGLGGRSRENTDGEKVRKAVSRAVQNSLDRITEHHPALGHHLGMHVSMGSTFRYEFPESIDWLT